MDDFVYKWQELIGALIGAATPISLWLIAEWYQSRKRDKEYLISLEKFFVYSINDIIDARCTLARYLKNQLAELIINIKANTAKNIYSVDTAFFPLFSVSPIDDVIFRNTSRSNYLENKTAHVHKLVRDFASSIEDIRRQFTHTLELHHSMAFGKVNAPNVQNAMFIRNLEEFVKMVHRDIFDSNVKICIKHLVYAKVAENYIKNKGYFLWRWRFSPSFKYFRSKKELQKYKEETFDRIELFLKPIVDKEIAEIEKLFS